MAKGRENQRKLDPLALRKAVDLSAEAYNALPEKERLRLMLEIRVATVQHVAENIESNRALEEQYRFHRY